MHFDLRLMSLSSFFFYFSFVLPPFLIFLSVSFSLFVCLSLISFSLSLSLISLYLSLSLSPSLSLSVSLTLFVSISVSPYLCLSLPLSLSLFVSVSFFLCTCLSVCLFVSLSFSRSLSFSPSSLYFCYCTGDTTYVARMPVNAKRYAGVPGGYVPSTNYLSLPYGCLECQQRSCEILTCSDHDMLYWDRCFNGKAPFNAVQANPGDYDRIYVGRTCTPLSGAMKPDRRTLIAHVPEMANSGPMLGKVHSSHRCLYVAIAGEEYNFSEYEVLCYGTVPPLTHTYCSTYSWIDARDGEVPQGALAAGMTSNGEVTYAARVVVNGVDVPGHLAPPKHYCQVSYAATEREHTQYQVLTIEDPAGFYWKLDSQGHLPERVVFGGEDGKKMGVGRTITGSDVSVGKTYKGVPIRLPTCKTKASLQLVGKVHPSHGCLYVPYEGLEYIYREYEVLVACMHPKSLKELCRNVVLEVTWGAPALVMKLPLSPAVLQYCLLTDEEKGL